MDLSMSVKRYARSNAGKRGVCSDHVQSCQIMLNHVYKSMLNPHWSCIDLHQTAIPSCSHLPGPRWAANASPGVWTMRWPVAAPPAMGIHNRVAKDGGWRTYLGLVILVGNEEMIHNNSGFFGVKAWFGSKLRTEILKWYKESRTACKVVGMSVFHDRSSLPASKLERIGKDSKMVSF